CVARTLVYWDKIDGALRQRHAVDRDLALDGRTIRAATTRDGPQEAAQEHDGCNRQLALHRGHPPEPVVRSTALPSRPYGKRTARESRPTSTQSFTVTREGRVRRLVLPRDQRLRKAGPPLPRERENRAPARWPGQYCW